MRDCEDYGITIQNKIVKFPNNILSSRKGEIGHKRYNNLAYASLNNSLTLEKFRMYNLLNFKPGFWNP